MKKEKYPIEYKMIPVQFAFLVSHDGTVQMSPVDKSKMEQNLEFKSEAEAREFISQLNEIV